MINSNKIVIFQIKGPEINKIKLEEAEQVMIEMIAGKPVNGRCVIQMPA
jgi:hypothetical protein